jgi:hypothetical protein
MIGGNLNRLAGCLLEDRRGVQGIEWDSIATPFQPFLEHGPRLVPVSQPTTATRQVDAVPRLPGDSRPAPESRRSCHSCPMLGATRYCRSSLDVAHVCRETDSLAGSESRTLCH